MSGWGLRLNPWGSSYSSLESEQMRFIHKAFCEAMEIGEEDLPLQLQMDDKFYPKYRPSPSDFDENTFMRKMQDTMGLLRNPAEAMISTICAYQRERHDRNFAFAGYLNDPRTLLLEEFKDWCMRTLASATCTTESILNDVRRRHAYILRLQHGQQGLFHSGNGERSLLTTLKDVRSVIETRVLPTIEAERAHSSAREQLTVLEARGTDGLMHGVQFLFYVFRNTANTPADCTISNLQSQQHAGMKDAMSTKSGQMLQVLLTTPSFKTLFPEASTSQRGEPLLPLQLTNEEETEMASTAVFTDDHSKAMVPSVLTRQTRSKDTQITPKDFLSSANSGLVPLRTEAASKAYDMFTKLHALLKLLADLLVSCRKARQLAGPGGDLLVYGPGGEEVRRLMQSLETVQQEINKTVSKMTQLGVRELDRLKPNQEKAWRYSFSKVLPLENYLAHDFGACVEPIQRIYANSDPVHVKKMYKQFRQATGMWVNENSAVCRQVSSALGTKFIERSTPALESDEEGPTIEMLEEEEPTDAPLAIMPDVATDTSLMDESENEHPNGREASGSILASAATFVTWAVGAQKTADEVPKQPDQERDGSSTPQNSDTDEEEMEKAPSSASSTSSLASGTSSVGVLDALLLVRQSISRVTQLSWGVRTSVHTSSIEEGDFDAFVVLCSIYEAVGVQCTSDLLLRLRQHRLRLRQLLQRHLASIVSCVGVVQKRIVDEDKSIRGMSLVYKRLERSLSLLEMEMDGLLVNFKQLMVETGRMKQGVLAMPLSQTRERPKGAAGLAFNSINALASKVGGTTAPSAAILSHGEFMAQMTSQLDLHWNSISHLMQSVKGTLEQVSTVSRKLSDCAKDRRNVVPGHQLDYIFEYNYDGFFRATTRDLQELLQSLDGMD